MSALASKYISKGSSAKKNCGSNKGDVFVASVINQKSVNQSAQQILVVIAAQVQNLYESQYGFVENSDDDTIYS